MHGDERTGLGTGLTIILLSAIVALGTYGPASVAGSSSSPPSTLVGVDQVFTNLNFDTTGDGCTHEQATCSATLNPAKALARGELPGDQTGTINAESFVGQEYRLEQACQDQPIHLAFTATFDYHYQLQRESNDGGTAEADVTIRGKTLTEQGSTTKFLGTGSEESGQDDVSDVTIEPFADQTNDTVYRTTVAPGVFVNSSDTELGGDTWAEANVSLHQIELTWGDDSAPWSNVTEVQSVASGQGSSEDFEGWFNQPVNVTINATDPSTDGANTTIASSCVKEIQIDSEEVDRDLGVEYHQGPNATTFDENAHFDLDISAVDNDGNIESPPTELRLGYDDLDPDTTIDVDPPTPTGENGWYDGSGGVNFVVNCDDSNGLSEGEFSGCKTIYLGETQDNLASTPDTTNVTHHVDIGEDQSIWAHSEDLATNADDLAESPLVNKDTMPPTIPANLSNNSALGNDWFNDPVTLSFDCSDGTSGCDRLQTENCDGTDRSNQTEFRFDEEGKNCKTGIGEDIAGHVNTKDVHVDIDFTAPDPVPNLTLTTSTSDAGGERWVNQQPRWEWDASSDNLSGLHTYRVVQTNADGSTVQTNTTDTSFEAENAPDGETCLTVTAIDKATNEGQTTDENCVFIDTTPPKHWFVTPDPNTLYLQGNGSVSFDRTMPSEGLNRSYVIGTIENRVNATDGDAPASGLAHSDIKEIESDDDIRDRGCDNTFNKWETCTWLDGKDAGGLGGTLKFRELFGQTRDGAGNTVTYAEATYTRIEIGVLTDLQDGSSQGTVFWESYTGDDFKEYEVRVSQTPDFLRGDGELVATVTDINDLDAVHQNPQEDTDLYYKLFAMSEGLTSDESDDTVQAVTHETHVVYEGDDASRKMSAPLACSTTTCT